MSATATPIHAILALATVNGESIALVLDADAAGTAACRKWAQQAGMKLIVESPGLERSRCNGPDRPEPRSPSMNTFRVTVQVGKAVPYIAELNNDDGGDCMEVSAITSRGVRVDMRIGECRLAFVHSADHALALGQQLIAAAQALQAAQSGDAA